MNSISKYLASVQAFLPKDKEIKLFIKCGKYSPVNNDWRVWTNDLGDKISFVGDDDKSILFEPTKSKDNSKDLYFKSPPEILIEKSVWGSLIFYKGNHVLFWLLGKDKILRILKWTNGSFCRRKFDGWRRQCGQ